MLKYRLAAAGLKLFSANGATQRAYRRLGNTFGGRRRRRSVNPAYLQRAHGNLRHIEAHGGIRDGLRLLELGTGWVHWEALFTRLFYDVRVVLFDVWDNRQFPGFLHYASELRHRLRTEVSRDPSAIARAEALLDHVLQARDFTEVYDLLGFEYLVEPSGSLGAVGDASIDLVISSDVLEHVPRAAMAALISDLSRILRPGGRTAHQIVFTDHLTIYDRTVHPKNYLRYSDQQWGRWFENGVQYINRLQPSDFARMFHEAGFEIEAETTVQTCDSSQLRIAEPFRAYRTEELNIAVNRIITRKPC